MLTHHKASVIRTQDAVCCIDCSTNQQTIACGAGTNIKIYDLNSCKQIGSNLIGNTDQIVSIKYSPDDNYLVSGGWDDSVRIWDLTTQQQIGMYHHEDLVRCVAYSIDGQYIASGSDDESIKIWNTQKKYQSGILLGHTNLVMSVFYSPNGKHLLSGSWDSTIRIWKLSDHRLLMKIQTSLYSVLYSLDGKFIISSGDGMIIKVWDSNTGKQIKQFIDRLGRVKSKAISPDHRLIMSGSNSGTVCLWEIATGKQIGRSILHDQWVFAVSIDGKLILSGSFDPSLTITSRSVFEEIN